MNRGELMREYNARASAIGLSVQVHGDGSPDAQIAIVAEAPGQRELELRTPLVGPTGKFLWQALQRIGVTRSQCYVTNVIKRQLAQSENERERIPQSEADHWTALLQWELDQLRNCRYILVLGSAALRSTVGHNSIDKWRGSCVEDDRGRWHIITYNPAFILRTPHLESVFAQDIYKLDMVRKGEYIPPVIQGVINPSPRESIDWCDKMQDEGLPISIDIETHANETACIGLANSVDRGMCINFRDRTSNRWSMAEELSVRTRIGSLLLDTRNKFVAQNGIFDAGWLYYKDRLSIHGIHHDTLLAHHTLYPTLPHDLGFLTAQYTCHPFYKDEREAWSEGGDIDNYWRYNVKDCCITLMVKQRLDVELHEQGLYDFFYGHVMRLQPHLILMTANGVPVDLHMKERLTVEIGARVETLKEEFQHAVRAALQDEDVVVNPGSPKQLSELFYNKLRLVARGNSVDATNRSKMLAHPGTSPAAKEVILALNRWAPEQKFVSTYARTKLDPDGRYRSEFKQYGTKSAPGRLSSSRTLWETGGNFQNQPPAARPMYIAPPGYEFFYFDLSQAEARVVAYEARIDKWKEQFETARLTGTYDCHRALASEMFRIPYEEVPKKDVDDKGDFTIRYIAKRCRHGLNYRMMWDRLAEVTKLPVLEAQRHWLVYHRTTPELQVWWKELEDEARTTKMLYNAYGRRLLFLGPITDESLEALVAFKPQSLVGDHCTKVIYQSHDDPRWPRDSRILINVHDSLTGLAPMGRGKDCLAICRHYAEAPITIRGEPLIIPADLALSTPDEDGVHRWSNLSKITL